jgi:DNA-binding response OmpR family regulator
LLSTVEDVMRLLIVEDDDDIAVVIEQTLKADGFDVDRSPDGPDGRWPRRVTTVLSSSTSCFPG